MFCRIRLKLIDNPTLDICVDNYIPTNPHIPDTYGRKCCLFCEHSISTDRVKQLLK